MAGPLGFLNNDKGSVWGNILNPVYLLLRQGPWEPHSCKWNTYNLPSYGLNPYGCNLFYVCLSICIYTYGNIYLNKIEADLKFHTHIVDSIFPLNFVESHLLHPLLQDLARFILNHLLSCQGL